MSALATQPGHRAAAPGELAVVQAFINTANIEAGKDELSTPTAFRRFLARHGLPGRSAGVTGTHLDRAVELREALRALTAANNSAALDPKAIEVVNREAQRVGLIAGFAPTGGPREMATASGADQALGELLAIVHRAMRDETWPRLKACREHGCRWSFFDHS